MKERNKRVLVGISGGIDDTAICLMSQEQGYEIVGVTACVWGDELQDVRELAARMGIEHYVADERIPFRKTIVKNFIDEYKQGRIPNPCVMCNPLFKFRVLTEQVDKLDCVYIATGYYFRLEERSGHIYTVARDDGKKDQSYFLWRLGQDTLKRRILPLGDYTKIKVCEYLAEKEYEVKSKEGESMEVCFIQGDYRDFLRKQCPELDTETDLGWFANSEGVKLGQHKGASHYTIGQRKGLEIALGKPTHVLKISPQKNTVMLGDAEQLQTEYMLAEQDRIVDEQELFSCENLAVRTRYRSRPIPCQVKRFEDGCLLVRSHETASAVAPGQSAVFYDGWRVLGSTSIASQQGIGLVIIKNKGRLQDKINRETQIKRLVLAVLIPTTAVGASAQFTSTNILKYRINLTDKAVTTYPIQQPEELLSRKSIDRRLRQKLAIDSTDLPVCKKYVDAMQKKGVHVPVTGKWDNFVTVFCNDSMLIDEIAKLSPVRSIEKVRQGEVLAVIKRDSLINGPQRSDGLYGSVIAQIEMSRANLFHDVGFKGQGMTIAAIDAGLHNVDRIEAMKNTHILGTRDFVNPEAGIHAEGNHGMSIPSCMAMNQPNVVVDTVPKAPYWLLCSEDEASEHSVEQDYWATAIEFVDSVGVDVANTSLGYYTFDDPTKNYRYRDLNGHYALMSREASKVADKGMALVCSAGNPGSGSWKKITPPGDAENVLTVGVTDKKKLLAPFSSVGNTAGGRVKLDVVAVGPKADITGIDGDLRPVNGTSFSSPIMCGMVACLWQACLRLTAREAIELMRSVGDRSDLLDNIYGCGIPDLRKAH